MGRLTTTLVRDLGMTLWMAWSAPHPSLKYRTSSFFISEAKNACRKNLKTLFPPCLTYDLLLERAYLKEKHWVYAILMATMESLPVLYKQCNNEEILQSILAKAYLGASSKLLDNLNDEIHTVDEALDSLENYLHALVYGVYRRKTDTPVEMAESSACEIATWIYQSLYGSPAFAAYVADCRNLVDGQISSLEHKNAAWPSLTDYVQDIAEKSIGDVWIDVDLCQFDELNEDLWLLKESNEYIFKSSLLYDDVQDLQEDIETKSVNSVVILALERNVISYEDLDTMNPAELAEILRRSDIADDIIHLADAFFLKGIYAFMDIKTPAVDKKGLLQSFYLVRLFNFRKLLVMNKDVKTLKKALLSFSDVESLKEQIPGEIGALVW